MRQRVCGPAGEAKITHAQRMQGTISVELYGFSLRS